MVLDRHWAAQTSHVASIAQDPGSRHISLATASHSPMQPEMPADRATRGPNAAAAAARAAPGLGKPVAKNVPETNGDEMSSN